MSRPTVAYSGIDLLVTLRIVLLDVLELSRVPERGHIPIQITQPLVKRRISRPDVANVAFEVLHVDGIETDDGCV